MGLFDRLRGRKRKRAPLQTAVRVFPQVPTAFITRQRVTESLVREQKEELRKLREQLERVVIEKPPQVEPSRPEARPEDLERLVDIRRRAEELRVGIFPQVLDRLLRKRHEAARLGAPKPLMPTEAAPPEPIAAAPIERGGFGESVGEGTSRIQKIIVERMEVPHADIEARISKGVELQEVSLEGVELPQSVPMEWTEKAVSGLQETYNLIPREPKEGELVFAMAEVKWNQDEKALVYSVLEPPMGEDEKGTLKNLEERLTERLSVDFTAVGGITSKQNYLRHHISAILDLFGIRLNDKQRAKLEYYIFRDFIGLGKMEPLMHDPDIEDISCDGVGIPLYVFHRDPRYGQLKTNVDFGTKEELDSFVMKIAQRCGKGISVASPLLDGALPDGSRVQATLGSDIARRGSNYTIRKFTEKPITPVDLLNFGTVDSLTLSYLWMAVEYGKSILVSGATATGKTSFLNALSLFIRPQLKIVSIEDTAELRLPHPNWIPEVSRSGLGEKAYGAVEMFDLLKSALRQRPDYIIVGEVRGAEANVMFQGMATGHPALGTIHADEVQKVVDRLTTPPINLSPALLENLDIIVILVLSKIGGRYVRRAAQVVEVKGVDIQNNRIIPNMVFKWDPAHDHFSSDKSSIMLAKIAAFKGVTDESIRGELLRRSSVMSWAQRTGITNYEEFAQLIARYYTEADQLIAEIMAKENKTVAAAPVAAAAASSAITAGGG